MKGLPAGRRGAALVLGIVLILGSAVAGTAVLAKDDAKATPKPVVTEVDIRPPSRQPAPRPEALLHTEAGATAFAKFYFDALNWSLSQGDTNLLADYTGAGCGQCTGYLISLQKWKSAGSRLYGGLTAPLDLAIGPYDPAQPVQFAATFLTTPATVTKADGTRMDYPGARTRGGLTLVWANDRWQMTELVIDISQAPATP